MSNIRPMHGVAVAVLSEDGDRLTRLLDLLQATRLSREVFSHIGLPVSATDPIIRRLQESRAEVVIVDVPSQSAQPAISAIELIRATTQIAIFANGEMTPTNIVDSWRNGASEYVDRSAGHEVLVQALTRFVSSRTRAFGIAGQARVFTFLSAKGGAGCTTAAVNTALALQMTYGDVILVDFAPIGHAAFHLNLRPQFTVLDALQNMHRMDLSLLEGFMTTNKEGLHLLAGPRHPYPNQPTPGDVARLFKFLVSHYRFVIVDASSRLDATTKLLSDLSNAVLLLAQTDIVSLASAGYVHSFLQEEGTGRDRFRIVLNRYKKIRGFCDKDIRESINCEVLWKIPNAFRVIAPLIDRGSPVVLQQGSEISRSYHGLAVALRTLTQSTHDQGPKEGDAAAIPFKKPKRSAAARFWDGLFGMNS